eukprot:4872393-Prymnesium_polylepis.2
MLGSSSSDELHDALCLVPMRRLPGIADVRGVHDNHATVGTPIPRRGDNEAVEHWRSSSDERKAPVPSAGRPSVRQQCLLQVGRVCVNMRRAAARLLAQAAMAEGAQV